MKLKPFALERYFAAHEFNVDYLLSASDCESLGLQELLDMADPESLRLWQDLRLGYTESQGHPELREEIAQLYGTVTADGVLVAAPEEAILLAMISLLEPGDHVIAPFPAYQSLYEVAAGVGCTITPWSFYAGPTGWIVDLEFLERAITPDTKLLVLNFPHNPTGFLPSRPMLDSIVHMAARHGVFVFSDEMYRFLEYAPEDRLPAVCDLYERAISLSGLSKSFALPGLRIGWLASHDRELLARCAVAKDYTTICSSAPGEVLAIAALRAAERIVTRNLMIVAANVALAADFFSRHQDRFAWLPPRAGSVALPRLLGEQLIDTFCEGLLAQKSVMLLPGSVFGMGENHFRLGMGRRNFAEGLARMEEYVVDWQASQYTGRIWEE